MTARLPFTQASVRRRIAAAKQAGLRVKGIATDGTVIVQDGENDLPQVPSTANPPQTEGVRPTSKWQDA